MVGIQRKYGEQNFFKGDHIMGMSFRIMEWEIEGVPKPMFVAGKIIRTKEFPHIGIAHLVKLEPGLSAPFPRTKDRSWWVCDINAMPFDRTSFRKALITWKEYKSTEDKLTKLSIKLSEQVYR